MRHPAYQKNKHLWESYGTHENADKITEKFLMIGVSQVNTEEHIETIINKVEEFLKQWKKSNSDIIAFRINRVFLTDFL